MANSKKKFLIKDWNEFVKQGRGCGRFENYRPAFTVSEVCSNAQRQRVHIRRFCRTFELMSHGETLSLFKLDWDDSVIEVREQFPLNPLITTKIARKLKLYHPGYAMGGTIMTTDFLVTYRKADGSVYKKAFQIKHSEADLENKRTLAKLSIESAYWTRLNVPWCVVLSSSFNKILCDNLEILHPYRETNYTENDLKFIYDILKQEIACNGYLHYENAVGELDSLPDLKCSISVTDGLKILLSHKYLSFPDHDKLLTDCYLKDFKENRHVQR